MFNLHLYTHYLSPTTMDYHYWTPTLYYLYSLLSAPSHLAILYTHSMSAYSHTSMVSIYSSPNIHSHFYTQTRQPSHFISSLLSNSYISPALHYGPMFCLSILTHLLVCGSLSHRYLCYCMLENMTALSNPIPLHTGSHCLCWGLPTLLLEVLSL